MKAISIRQPWAWLIVEGYKDIENRSWPTDYRGRILIHASKTVDVDSLEALRETEEIDFPETFHTGGIIGEVNIVACVTRYKSDWFTGPYGFLLKRPRRLEFQPCRGRLGIFTID